MNKINQKFEYVEGNKNIDNIVFHCWKSQKRGVKTAYEYFYYLKQTYPDSNQRVYILKDGIRQFQQLYPQLVGIDES